MYWTQRKPARSRWPRPWRLPKSGALPPVAGVLYRLRADLARTIDSPAHRHERSQRCDLTSAMPPSALVEEVFVGRGLCGDSFVEEAFVEEALVENAFVEDTFVKTPLWKSGPLGPR